MIKSIFIFRMAAFPSITIADNPDGWGPTVVPESLLKFPYHVYSKGERLGKVLPLIMLFFMNLFP